LAGAVWVEATAFTGWTVGDCVMSKLTLLLAAIPLTGIVLKFTAC
jgi:hypothetical protein